MGFIDRWRWLFYSLINYTFGFKFKALKLTVGCAWPLANPKGDFLAKKNAGLSFLKAALTILLPWKIPVRVSKIASNSPRPWSTRHDNSIASLYSTFPSYFFLFSSAPKKVAVRYACVKGTGPPTLHTANNLGICHPCILFKEFWLQLLTGRVQIGLAGSNV